MLHVFMIRIEVLPEIFCTKSLSVTTKGHFLEFGSVHME